MLDASKSFSFARSAYSSSFNSFRLPYLLGLSKGTPIESSLVQTPCRSGSPQAVFGAVQFLAGAFVCPSAVPGLTAHRARMRTDLLSISKVARLLPNDVMYPAQGLKGLTSPTYQFWIWFRSAIVVVPEQNRR